MRDYIFIRHGRPDIPIGERICLGRTDLGLGALGRMQACLLGSVLHSPVVYSSTMKRALETAAFLGDEIIPVPGLEEGDCGDWDGLSFEEIRQKWPYEYEQHGRDRSFPIPGAEELEAIRLRAMAALEKIPSGSIVVSHNMVICALTGIDTSSRLPYCCFVSDGKVSVAHPEMTPELARSLRTAAAIPEKIIHHCDAVAQEALRLSDGLGLDNKLIECASILHDIARTEKKHEQIGAEYIKALGYPELGDIIRQHGTPDRDDIIDEASVVFLADKYMSNTERVSIDERYDRTLCKCLTPEAIERHERSRRFAKTIEGLFSE